MPAKQPWYIFRADTNPLLFAGLWESQEEVGDTYTILTTGANAFIERIHNRMPVVLEPERAEAWLRSGDVGLLRPAPDGVLAARQVSTRVNSPKNNEPSLIDAVGNLFH